MDLIDRQAAIEAMSALYSVASEQDAINILSELPTADVAEVRHGRWKYVKKRLARGGYVDASECSVCHKIIMPHLKPNYCPNCGSRMDLDGDTE